MQGEPPGAQLHQGEYPPYPPYIHLIHLIHLINSTKMSVNEFLERSIRRLLPNEFAERKKTFEDEMSDIAGGSAMEDGRVSFSKYLG